MTKFLIDLISLAVFELEAHRTKETQRQTISLNINV